jgi:hypothetical protein
VDATPDQRIYHVIGVDVVAMILVQEMLAEGQIRQSHACATL